MSKPTGKFLFRYTDGQWELKGPAGEPIEATAIEITADHDNPAPVVRITLLDCDVEIEVPPENFSRKALS